MDFLLGNPFSSPVGQRIGKSPSKSASSATGLYPRPRPPEGAPSYTPEDFNPMPDPAQPS